MIELPEKIRKQTLQHFAFFADGGISMSEANTVAGKAGDIADTVNRLLAQTGSFVKMATVDDKTVTLVAPKKIEKLVEIATRDGDLYGLKAYLTEAIKAKNALIQTLKTADKNDFLETNESLCLSSWIAVSRLSLSFRHGLDRFRAKFSGGALKKVSANLPMLEKS